MKILKNYNLSNLNTFNIKAKAKFFVEINKEEDLIELFSLKEFKENKKLFLGGGSNVLFLQDFAGFVVLNKLKKITIIKEDKNNVYIKAFGGELWQDLVLFCTKRNYWGIENLSLIPGTVGASPVQNIGAYGVELKDIFYNLEAYEIKTGKKKIFNKKECQFGYRDSIFKNKLKDKYFISAVVFKLTKKENKNINYRALKDYLNKNKIKIKKSKDISDVVSDIRKSKLPDPKFLPNAGSFFKNVYISKSKLNKLKKIYSDIPFFEEEEKTSPSNPLLNQEKGNPISVRRGEVNTIIKIPTAWLIEQAGFKGKRMGKVGVYQKQALILVNYGGATGLEVKKLAQLIIKSIYQKFKLKIEIEVNLV
jgi:UDP-N-acetylmuramate dehydrogenase